MFRFESLWAFRLLWLILGLVVLWFWTDRRGRNKLNQILGSRLTPFLAASLSTQKRKW